MRINGLVIADKFGDRCYSKVRLTPVDGRAHVEVANGGVPLSASFKMQKPTHVVGEMTKTDKDHINKVIEKLSAVAQISPEGLTL